VSHPQSLRESVAIPILIVGLTSAACGTPAGGGRIEPVYDDATGRLQLLKYDANGDGTIDTWSYMDGARVVRVELDPDQNNVIDRWEYYGSDQAIEKVGTSRAGDNTPDSWAFYDGSGTNTKLELSTHRDGKVDRVEYYDAGARVRAEEDTNADGRVDKWEAYEGTRLAAVSVDTQQRGRPDRRVVYAQDGNVRIEELP
jgi:5-hydroxyisourate hydrolase-like protein (transthyretin family)